MHGERVPEGVRRDLGADARLLCPLLEDQPEALAGESIATVVQEEGLLLAVARNERSGLFQIRLEGANGGGVNGNDALARSLAAGTPGASDNPLTQIDVAEVRDTSSVTLIPVAYSSSNIALSRLASGVDERTGASSNSSISSRRRHEAATC